MLQRVDRRIALKDPALLRTEAFIDGSVDRR